MLVKGAGMLYDAETLKEELQHLKHYLPTEWSQ
jgi:hypothetical protein